MPEDYTPTTEELRQKYATGASGQHQRFSSAAVEFDRWLAAHDAEKDKRIAGLEVRVAAHEKLGLAATYEEAVERAARAINPEAWMAYDQSDAGWRESIVEHIRVQARIALDAAGVPALIEENERLRGAQPPTSDEREALVEILARRIKPVAFLERSEYTRWVNRPVTDYEWHTLVPEAFRHAGEILEDILALDVWRNRRERVTECDAARARADAAENVIAELTDAVGPNVIYAPDDQGAGGWAAAEDA